MKKLPYTEPVMRITKALLTDYVLTASGRIPSFDEDDDLDPITY